MGPVGGQEMIVIFLLALILFGPKKLPELGRTIGRALSEFRRAQNELKATLQRHMNELEKENESLRELTRNFNGDVYSSNYHDSYNYDSRTYGTETQESISQPASQSTIAGASAIQGAEINPADQPWTNEAWAPANGTVPRGTSAAPATDGHEPADRQPHSPAENPAVAEPDSTEHAPA
jgi:sec-independent protein translocase protein TatA